MRRLGKRGRGWWEEFEPDEFEPDEFELDDFCADELGADELGHEDLSLGEFAHSRARRLDIFPSALTIASNYLKEPVMWLWMEQFNPLGKPLINTLIAFGVTQIYGVNKYVKAHRMTVAASIANLF